jgi:hypothetical protein
MKTTMVLAAVLFSAGAQAADAVTDAMQAAYAPYRAALFRTNSSSPQEAMTAMGEARQAWQSFMATYGKQAPSPYDRDQEFGASLQRVRAIYDKADAEIAASKLPEAHETLEEARDVLAALRLRNGVFVFSDAMNAYHAEMEHLLKQAPQWLGSGQGLLELTAQAGTLDYLVRQLRVQASAPLRQNAEFDALLAAVEASVLALKQAAFAQDAVALKQAISKLKAPYSRLFLKFG